MQPCETARHDFKIHTFLGSQLALRAQRRKEKRVMRMELLPLPLGILPRWQLEQNMNLWLLLYSWCTCLWQAFKRGFHSVAESKQTMWSNFALGD